MRKWIAGIWLSFERQMWQGGAGRRKLAKEVREGYVR